MRIYLKMLKSNNKYFVQWVDPNKAGFFRKGFIDHKHKRVFSYEEALDAIEFYKNTCALTDDLIYHIVEIEEDGSITTSL